MIRTLQATTVSVSIERPPAEVYAFVANPENLPRWAAGLGGSVVRSGAGWIIETPGGPVRIAFTEPNTFGILDHTVYPSPDQPVYVPMRVVPNGDGSEAMLTVFRLPDMTDEQYTRDLGQVTRDLETLKHILEQRDG
jgi:hypothetical protein